MIVGVEMEVVYMVETAPSQRDMDNPYFDGKNAVTYRYDLELDMNGNAIGGEWYTNRHPDFLWLPPQETRALTHLDRRIESAIQQGSPELVWSMDSSIPEAWRPHIPSHSRQGQPLGLVVEGLIKRANAE